MRCNAFPTTTRFRAQMDINMSAWTNITLFLFRLTPRDDHWHHLLLDAKQYLHMFTISRPSGSIFFLSRNGCPSMLWNLYHFATVSSLHFLDKEVLITWVEFRATNNGHVSIWNVTQLDDNSESASITDQLVSSSCDAFPTCKLTRLNWQPSARNYRWITATVM